MESTRYKKLAKAMDELFSPERMNRYFSENEQKRQYEDRTDQQSFAHTVLESFELNGVALLEAGTGIGKSLGYLIPAILWALETGQRVVISTHTIPLQEQLLYKEIPLALHLLGKEIGFGIAKGMSNYLCELKMEQHVSSSTLQEGHLFEEKRDEKLHKLQKWAKRESEPVTKSRLPIAISSQDWMDIAANSEECLRSQCPFFSTCHFFRARKRLHDYKIIVVNHHLLLHDLLQRSEAKNWEGSFVLPPYMRVIIDEGHHLEEVATALFQIRVERFDHLHTIRQGTTHLSPGKEASPLSKLLVILQKKSAHFDEMRSVAIARFIEFELHHRSVALEKSAELFFESLFACASHHGKKASALFGTDLSNGQLRITPSISMLELFQKCALLFSDHKEKYSQLAAAWAEFFDFFKKREFDCDTLNIGNIRSDEEIVDPYRFLLSELKTNQERLQKQIHNLELFFQSIDNSEKVCWIEWHMSLVGGMQISSVISSFYVGNELRKNLFDPMGTTLLVSATLTTKGNFSFIKERLGLHFFQKETSGVVLEKIYPSPFPYEKNALFLTCTNLISSEDSKYIVELQTLLFKIAQASDGGALFLFTSYSILEKVYPFLLKNCTNFGLFPLKQGDMPRSQLLKSFQKNTKGVLCATDSFWEGVDIPGKTLRTVVITKLPFDVPSDPMYEARHEAMEKRGLNSFIHYALPRAVVKFKQAFGRLIRQENDFGVVVCLDSRISQKGYGKVFLEALPSCEIRQASVDVIPSIIQERLALYDSF